jgi:hypothetical protein
MRPVATIAAAAVITAALTAPAAAQSAPPIAIPRNLEAYANPKTVIANATRVIAAFKGAQLTWPPYPKLDPVITADCDRAEIRSFYNGYRLAMIGYNAFLSLQETGRFATPGPVGSFYAPADAQRFQRFPRRRFAQFGRAALLAFWPAEAIGQLIEAREALRQWDEAQRRDLAAFLRRLIEYRAHYRKLQGARPSALGGLCLVALCRDGRSRAGEPDL